MSGRVYDYLAMLCLLMFVVIVALVFSNIGVESKCEQRSAIELPRCKNER